VPFGPAQSSARELRCFLIWLWGSDSFLFVKRNTNDQAAVQALEAATSIVQDLS
jgi:hypothetical protein